jgi:hypothetical protein
MKNFKTLKVGSRIENNNGYLITTKCYQATIVQELKFNYVTIKIGDKLFKTDFNNLK